MSEEVRRVGRELVYKGAILEVYNCLLYTSLGAHSVPIRLLNPAEMVVLVLNGD